MTSAKLMNSEQLYKILGPDRQPCNGGSGQWPAPGTWLTVTGKLRPCANGLHLCRPQDLLTWLSVGREIWHVEKRGRAMIEDDKIVVREARLIGDGPVCVWTERLNHLLACDYAEHVLPIYERQCPDDRRPRRAIEVTRLYASGQATKADMEAAAYAASVSYAAYVSYVSYAYYASYVAYAAYAASYSDTEREWQVERLLDYIEGRAK